MNPVAAFTQGMRAVVRSPRLWLFYWLLAVLFGAVMAAPAFALLAAGLGRSRRAEAVLGNFDFAWIFESLYRSRGAEVLPLVLTTGVLLSAYMLVNTWLSGGAIAHFARAGGGFWEACGRNFPRLLLLLLYSLPAYLAVATLYTLLTQAGGRIWQDSMEERPMVLYTWVVAALAGASMLLVNMVFDYARIRVVTGGSQPLRAPFEAWSFVLRNPARAIGTYLLVAAAVAVWILLYQFLSGQPARDALPGIAAVALIQQVFVAGRVGLRLCFYAALILQSPAPRA